MNPWKRKPDPFKRPTTNPINIDEIWQERRNDEESGLKAKPTRSTDIPHNALVYSLNALSDIYSSVPINREIVESIQRKLAPFSESTLVRQKIYLYLLIKEKIETVVVWVIPVFADGSLFHYVYAADDNSQELLRQHRNEVKTDPYDITSV